MKFSRFVPNCIMILFLAGTTFSAPLAIAAPPTLRAETASAEATPAPEATASPEASPSPAQTAPALVLQVHSWLAMPSESGH